MRRVKLVSLGFDREGRLIGRIHDDVLHPNGEKLHTVPINHKKAYDAIDLKGLGLCGSGWVDFHHLVGQTFRFEDLSDAENPIGKNAP